MFQHPTEVDYKIMSTFVEFYSTLLGFVNFRLYSSINLAYPPRLTLDNEETGASAAEKDMCSPFERFEEVSVEPAAAVFKLY